jgi:glycosyltransferase involved in cell wall biosynthesis
VKIAFVCQPQDEVIFAQPNSLGIWTTEVARRLAQSYEVTVYTKHVKNFEPQKKVVTEDGVCYKRILLRPDQKLINFLKRVWDFITIFNLKTPLYFSSFYYLLYALQIALDLKKQQCDIVHILNYSQFVPIIRFCNPKAKIVLHMQCEWLNQLNHKIVEKRLRHVDLVIGCSNYITKESRKKFPQFAHLFRTIYNGVDVERFISKNSDDETRDDRSKRLLFVGRVSPEKGVHVLLEAFQKIAELYPEVQLEIVGVPKAVTYEFVVALSDDPKVLDLASFYPDGWINYLSQWQNSSSVASKVCFTGSVPHSQLVNYYQKTDIFIFPSVWNEPFGIPIIEAMATGVPVVATRGGAFPEIVAEGKTGLLVERGDASALAAAILHLLQNEDLRKSMGKAGRQRVLEAFSWERIVQNLSYQYQSICDCPSVLSTQSTY